MPLLNYVLLALIGSSGATGLPAAKPATTLGPEAIAQPNGGALLLSGQETPKKEDGRRQTLSTNYTRYKKHSRRHGKSHRTVKHSHT